VKWPFVRRKKYEEIEERLEAKKTLSQYYESKFGQLRSDYVNLNHDHMGLLKDLIGIEASVLDMDEGHPKLRAVVEFKPFAFGSHDIHFRMEHVERKIMIEARDAIYAFMYANLPNHVNGTL